MRVLLIAGLAESLVNFRGPLISALQAHGCDVHVAAPGLHDGQPMRTHLEHLGLTTHNVPMARTGTDPLADLRTVWVLAGLLYKIQPEIILSYTIKPVIYGSLAAWLVNVPHRFALITGLGYAFLGEGQRAFLKRLVKGLYKIALSRVHKVFFQNPDDQALFRQEGILNRNILSVVLNGSGIDVSHFRVAPAVTDEVTFLLIARLMGDKGIREYVEAARLLRGRFSGVKFLLVGWVDQNPDAIKQCELDGWVASGAVEFLGRLSDVRPVISRCSVYVLPSYREGTPRSVLEAMAMGRPIITTDAPGCRETVIDGENGFLVPVKSVEALAAAMEKFITSPELISQMGLRSRQIAEQKYDVHKVNQVMLKEMGILQ